MIGVLTGFAIIAVIMATGYIVAATGIAGEQAQFVLNRISFFIATPALMFTTIAHSDIHALFSVRFPLAAISVACSIALFLGLSALVRRERRRSVGELVIGSLSASLLNANNIGLPVAIYVFGSYAEVVPVLLFQLLILNPVMLTILDAARTGKITVLSALRQPFTNPLVIASGLGLIVALWLPGIPAAVFEPFEIVGGAAIPMILLAFGMSLRGNGFVRRGAEFPDIIIATLTKSVLMPAVTFLIAAFVFRLDGVDLAGAVMVSALPTAQNVFNFANRYGVGVVLARDTALLTTIAAVPVLSALALLLL